MLQEHTEREATADLQISFESFLQQTKAMKNSERCTSPEDGFTTPEVPENTFKIYYLTHQHVHRLTQQKNTIYALSQINWMKFSKIATK